MHDGRADKIADVLSKEGYAVVEGLVDRSTMDRIAGELRPHFEDSRSSPHPLCYLSVGQGPGRSQPASEQGQASAPLTAGESSPSDLLAAQNDIRVVANVRC